jgi:outer membrane protein OmpU
MKKILFATTALVLSAGVAAAEVKVSAMARFGVVSTEAAGTTTTDVSNRFQFNVSGSTTSDTGIEFAGKIRARSSNGAMGTVNGAAASMSVAGITVHVGNVPGPLDNMANGYANVGYTGGNWTNVVADGGQHAYRSTGAQNALQIDYSMDPISVSFSTDRATETNAATVHLEMNGITLAVGGQEAPGTANDATALTIGGTIADIAMSVGYGEVNSITSSMAVAEYKFANALSVKGYVYDEEGASDTGFGLGARYSLGGGATMGAAYENISDGSKRIEAGVTFSF